jgi:hypothetical protein
MIMKKSILALALCAVAAAPAFAIDCNSFPNNTITGYVNDDVTAYDVTCTIARTGFVNGNLYQYGIGDLVIRGKVNGGVEERGAGGITLLPGSEVNGEISEFNGGNVVVRGGSTLGGNVHEYGAGSITVLVDRPGKINADLHEHGTGSVFVKTVTGSFGGSVFEKDAGDVDVTVASGTVFNGNIEEGVDGSLLVYVDGRFEGNMSERGRGNLRTEGNGAINGNSEHELPGQCSNTVRNFEGAVCNLQ